MIKYHTINYYAYERLVLGFGGLALCVLGIISSLM